MPVVTCPKCESRYDPGMDDELEGIDPSQMSLKVSARRAVSGSACPRTNRR